MRSRTGPSFLVSEMRGLRCFWGLPLACFLAIPSAGRGDEPARVVDYAADIKPILARHCTSCHGAEKQKSGLRLDLAGAIRKGGDSGPAIEPGKSGESLLIQAITGAEGVAAMPPKGEPPLSNDEISLLKTWVDQGAKAPEAENEGEKIKGAGHWSFQPVVRPAVPQVVDP